MKWLVAASLLLVPLGAEAANDFHGCGPGCHFAVNGGCVVNGWETGAVAWNECPVGAHPRPPCYAPHVWRKQAKTCVHVD